MGLFEAALDPKQRRPANSPRGEGGYTGVERRSIARQPTLRSTHTSMTSNRWDLNLVPATAIERLSDAIDGLQERSLERNLFFRSTVLRAAWPRLTSVLAPKGLFMLCLWETIGEDRHLRLFMPIRIAKAGVPRQTVVQPLANEFMPIGTPLVDAVVAAEASEVLLRLMGDPALGLPPILDMTFQRQDEPTIRLLRKAADSLDLRHANSSRFQRAALKAPGHSNTTAEQFLQQWPGKRRKRELSRQMRRLEELGTVSIRAARDVESVLDAFESFLTLELRSWKGNRNSALYNHKRIATFSRQIVTELAMENACEIVTINLTPKDQTREILVAGVIMLGSDGQFAPWKMAFNEDYAAHSPGMQAMVQATRALVEDEGFVEADSLAKPDHWMMNHIWPHRLEIAHTSFALSPEGNAKLNNVVAAQQRWDNTKAFLKRLLRR